MGSAIAIELASKVPAAGIALEGASTSALANIGVHYRYIPWSLLISERYESIERINGITIPKIYIHASDDEAVPISQARELNGMLKSGTRYEPYRWRGEVKKVM